MTELLKRNKLAIAGTIVGAVAGWVYWKLVGCNLDGCAITGNPLNSTLNGALLLGSLSSLIEHRDK